MKKESNWSIIILIIVMFIAFCISTTLKYLRVESITTDVSTVIFLGLGIYLFFHIVFSMIEFHSEFTVSCEDNKPTTYDEERTDY